VNEQARILVVDDDSDQVFAYSRVQSPEDIRLNMMGFGWDIKQWEEEGRWAFVDASSQPEQEEIVGLFTATPPTLIGGTSVTETHISTITDSIILLRYVEMFGEMKRGLMVLKMHSSLHNKDICEFIIDAKGMHIGKPFRGVNGILAGNPQHFTTNEVERLTGLFKDE
jgi:KaiC/GvpD/RAD55 family RecA-like ATPase